MLKRFLLVWLIYWATVALLPVHSLAPATLEALGLQGFFVALVAVGFMVVTTLLPAVPLPIAGQADIPRAARVVRWAIALSLFGLACSAYDKIVIQGIDYSEGVAVAREAWRQLGEEREGAASSIFSVLGYLFGNAYFVATVLAITQPQALSTRARGWTLLACFAFLIANSLITGGRSSVLLLAVFVIGAVGARRGLPMRRLFPTRSHRRLLFLVPVAGFSYAVYVFYIRAAAGDTDALEYALDFLPFLGLQVDGWYHAWLDGDTLSSLSAMVVLALSYITHSFATVAAIVDAPTEDKTIIFLHAMGILHKIGLAASPDGDWFLSGRLPSVPGALWHQWGGVGFVIGSLAIGVFAAVCRFWTARRPTSLPALGAAVAAESTLLLSPAVFAADLLSFPFAAASFIMLAVLQGSGARSAMKGSRRRMADHCIPGGAASPSVS